MLKKAIAATALLAVSGAPISAYAATATLGRATAPVTASSQGNGKKAALYVLLAGAVVGGIILATDGNGSDSP